jgi:hypothetical protein
MNRPSLSTGIVVAAVASVVGAVLCNSLIAVLPPETVLRVMVAGLGFAYAVYLLLQSGEAVGRVLAVIVWLLMSTLSWLAVSSGLLFLLLHIGALWLLRSLYFHSSAIGALMDLCLCAFSFAAAFVAALHTGSYFLAIWCFFAAQAFFAVIPVSVRPSCQGQAVQQLDAENFQRAFRRAEASIRRLSSNIKP